ncbi:MAG: glycosyltransferase [Abditibacteriota bacterium]|nr:glycosyltransferase [Abditibacteriota bacterium]
MAFVTDKKIAVLLPCYNEAETIVRVIEDYRSVFPTADIYVYDNNSTDGSGELARGAGARVVREYRQGKGFVIKSMFRDIEADCYVMADSDLTYPACEAEALAKAVLEGEADMAIGDRLSSTYFAENKRPFHGFGNRLVRYLINRIFRGNIKDIMTGMRAFSRAFVAGYPVLSRGFEIETEMTVHALDRHYLIKEIPINYKDRPSGSASKLNTYRDGFRVLGTLFTLFKNYRPLQFFGAIGLILGLAALAMFIPILTEFMSTGKVPRFPTLIVSVAVGSASVMSFVCGIILDTIKRYSDQTYLMLQKLSEKDGK